MASIGATGQKKDATIPIKKERWERDISFRAIFSHLCDDSIFNLFLKRIAEMTGTTLTKPTRNTISEKIDASGSSSGPVIVTEVPCTVLTRFKPQSNIFTFMVQI
ncbi:MAG: hypothetical protein ACXQS8_09360 [Candidatus Helarchaeales archaeon]